MAMGDSGWAALRRADGRHGNMEAWLSTAFTAFRAIRARVRMSPLYVSTVYESVWVHMGPYGVPKESVWIRIDLIGPYRSIPGFLRIPYGSVWICSDTHGVPICIHMDLVRIHMDPYGSYELYASKRIACVHFDSISI